MNNTNDSLYDWGKKEEQIRYAVENYVENMDMESLIDTAYNSILRWYLNEASKDDVDNLIDNFGFGE